MALAHGAHLVGGLVGCLRTEAMTTTAGLLGDRLERLTDGETGERSQWIWWQIDKLTAVEGISLGEPQVNPATGNPDYSVFPGLEVERGIAIADGSLGYAEAAEASYREFVRLREAGTIPAQVRFQVSLPTPYAVVDRVGETGSPGPTLATLPGRRLEGSRSNPRRDPGRRSRDPVGRRGRDRCP